MGLILDSSVVIAAELRVFATTGITQICVPLIALTHPSLSRVVGSAQTEPHYFPGVAPTLGVCSLDTPRTDSPGRASTVLRGSG